MRVRHIKMWDRNNSSIVNPLDYKGNNCATSNNIKLVHWPFVSGLLHLVQRGRDWAEPQSAQAPLRCTKCNSPPINGQYIPITVLLYNGPLFCGSNVPIKGLTKMKIYLVSVAGNCLICKFKFKFQIQRVRWKRRKLRDVYGRSVWRRRCVWAIQHDLTSSYIYTCNYMYSSTSHVLWSDALSVVNTLF